MKHRSESVGMVIVVFLLLIPGGAARALADAPRWAGDLRQVLEEREPGEGFGSAAVTAGDLDGDGRSDLAVGAASAGRVYVYYGTGDGYPASPDVTLTAPAGAVSFGAALAPAGDVDGDGYADLLVGAPGGSGHLYLYCGGPSGVGTSPCWEVAGTDPGERLGAAVAWAGDVDRDGYDDVLAGAPGWNGDTGRALLYRGGPGGPGAEPWWSVDGRKSGERLGASVAGGVDVTGDEYPDVLVGAPGSSGSAPERGRALLFPGGPGGPATDPAWKARGSAAMENFGEAVALPGDMNGDGFGDVAIGAPGFDGDGAVDVGRVSIWAGGAGGPGEEPLWQVEGTGGEGGRLGASLATVGDVDGDRLADLAVGSPGAAGGAGSLLLVFGRDAASPLLLEVPSDTPGLGLGDVVGAGGDPDGDGLADVVAAGPGTVDAAPRVLVVAGLRRRLAEGDPDWIHYGGARGAEYGTVVTSAGDVNGDGFDDLLVGNFAWDEDGSLDVGRAQLFLGGPGGPSDEPVWTVVGSQAGAQLGISVACAGDVNGDGYDDVLVAAWREAVTVSDEGRVYLYLGGPDGLAREPAWSIRGRKYGAQLGLAAAGAGDVNGDGFSDVVVTAPGYWNDAGGEGIAYVFLGSRDGLAETPDWTFEPTWSDTWFGTMAGRAGDVNGDGYDDLFITDMDYTDGETREGIVLVFHGSPAGLPADPSWSFQEDHAGTCLGYSAACAGDVNGDGYEDLVVSGAGAWGGSRPPSPAEQVVHVFHGGPDGLSESPDFTRHGYEDDGDYGSDVSGLGDINGDGYGDVVIGSDWYSVRGIDEEGRLDLHLGGPDGLAYEPAWVRYGGDPRANLGVWCRPAGDLDGDGLVDLVAGAQYLSRDYDNEGAALVFLGDRGGLAVLPRQLDPGEERPVALLGLVHGLDAYRVRLALGGPLAPGDQRLVVEDREARPGTEPEVFRGAWEPTRAGSGEEHEATVEGVAQGSRRAWRARAEYRGNPFVARGPWLERVGAGPAVPKLRMDRDGDGDGVGGWYDCDDTDPATWNVPGECTGLAFLEDKVTLTWDPPAEPGADPETLVYDTLRSDDPGNFGPGKLVEEGGDDEQSVDEEVPGPGDLFSYLVRARNACGCGTLGTSSLGEERVAGGCP